MKTKLAIALLTVTTAILSGCATVNRCPACGAKGHYNSVTTQVVGSEKRHINYVQNNKQMAQEYTVPKIASTTDSWECDNGHVIQVKH